MGVEGDEKMLEAAKMSLKRTPNLNQLGSVISDISGSGGAISTSLVKPEGHLPFFLSRNLSALINRNLREYIRT